MPFTSKLGTPDSKLANIELGAAGAAPPPPPPPPSVPLMPGAHRPLTISGIRPPYFFGSPVPVVLDPPFQYPAFQQEQTNEGRQIRPPDLRATIVQGPWHPTQFIPIHVELASITQAGVTPPPPVDQPPYFAPQALSRFSHQLGPWNQFGQTRPVLDPPNTTPTNPPGPPPPPPPGSVFGPPRGGVPSVPRAPWTQTIDPRTREHIDAVAGMLNELSRLGYIRKGADGQYAITGGGIALPRPPTAHDDESVGAVIGMTYVDTLNDDVYVCTNNTLASAVWKLIS